MVNWLGERSGGTASSNQRSPPGRGSWAPPAGRRRSRRPLWWRTGPLRPPSPGRRSRGSAATPPCPPPPPVVSGWPAHCTTSTHIQSGICLERCGVAEDIDQRGACKALILAGSHGLKNVRNTNILWLSSILCFVLLLLSYFPKSTSSQIS